MAEGVLLEKSHVEWSEIQDSNEWDDFVVQNGGSIFHLWSWRRVLESDDSRPLYLACRDAGGRILAVCPFLCQVGKRLLYLNSLPDSLMAGPIISGRATNTSQIIASLRKSVKFSPFNPVVAMQIKAHQQQIIQPMVALGFQYDVTHGLFILDLHEKTPEHIWNNGFQKHDRRAVKYYEQKGSGFGFARHESDYLSYLALQRPDYRNYKDRRANADFFPKMRANFGDDRVKVAFATLEDKVIAGLSMLCDPANSIVHLVLVRYSPINIHEPMANVTYINWKVINWAYEHGFRYVDFGSYSVAGSSDPTHPHCKLKERFEITFVPRYQFTLPTSSISYSMARGINRVIQVAREIPA